MTHHPANTKYLYDICTTPAQRLRRWSNIVQMLYKCFVFAGQRLLLLMIIIIFITPSKVKEKRLSDALTPSEIKLQEVGNRL